MQTTIHTLPRELTEFDEIELLVADVIESNYIYEDVALDALAVRFGFEDFADYDYAHDAARLRWWHLQDKV
jgi:hypothetical protein